MTGFDIKTLVDFQPPKYLCETCKGILFDFRQQYVEIEGAQKAAFKCPICDQIYIEDDLTPWQYMQTSNQLKFGNLLEHSQRMANIVGYWDTDNEYRSYTQILLTALSAAKQFVHFTTFGIHSYFVGALKLIGTKVSVNGIISNPNEWVIEELEDKHSPKFKAKIFRKIHPGSIDDMPHQKLIVIDGLIAFKGSANLTTNGWEKAAKKKDLIEVVTNVNEIAKLHNRLFSPNWAGEGTPELIRCTEIPF